VAHAAVKSETVNEKPKPSGEDNDKDEKGNGDKLKPTVPASTNGESAKKGESGKDAADAISLSPYEEADQRQRARTGFSTTFNTKVAKVFESCFSDESKLEEAYHISSRRHGCEHWQLHGYPKFGKIRYNTYTVKLTGPVGPPTSRVKETQRYNLQATSL
jgi:hypothetical protein